MLSDIDGVNTPNSSPASAPSRKAGRSSWPCAFSARLSWLDRCLNATNEAVRRPVLDSLRAHCRQDTLAMVQLREALLA